MLRGLNIRHRTLPLLSPFRISRGVKHTADVVTAVHAMGADEAILVNPKTGRLEDANDRRRPPGLAAGD